MTVALSATDDPTGSGVASITYSATGAQPIASTTVSGDSTSVSITTEGITTLSYFATDVDGNTSAVGTLTIRIDKKHPEAYLQWDTSARHILVFGRDSLSGTGSAPFAPVSVVPRPGHKELRTYVVSDLAGNTETLVVEVKPGKDDESAEIKSVRYDSGPTIWVTDNTLDVNSETKNGSLKKLDQDARVGDHKTVKAEADYDGKKDETKVELETRWSHHKATVHGLVLIQLATHHGQLRVEFDPDVHFPSKKHAHSHHHFLSHLQH